MAGNESADAASFGALAERVRDTIMKKEDWRAGLRLMKSHRRIPFFQRRRKEPKKKDKEAPTKEKPGTLRIS